MKFVIVFALFAVSMAAPSARDLLQVYPTDDATTGSLRQDLRDIFDVLPAEEWRAIAKEHLNNDPEFQQVVAYLQSKEWDELLNKATTNANWKKFKTYMLDAGVDIDKVVRNFHDLIAGAKPEGKASITRSMRSFVDEAFAAVDTDKLMGVIMDKMANSEDFKEFYAKVSSEEARALIEKIRAVPEMERIGQRLRDMGFDIDKVVEGIYKVFGWA